ncbi:unnamed protein product [Adineta ricciae]|uniref:Amidohydrolase 3 domain-containing protein n=1 Tax=Adineta ricciae TaxID=249248 RepID=A0A815NBN1_ADIRI|nr:unnamed protein product [Adineta ricciae]CAF1434556.1 unnamed protein product [Adineta ricciae]
MNSRLLIHRFNRCLRSAFSTNTKSRVAPTMALLNGNIWTGNKEHPHAQAIACVDDMITHVGSNSDVLSLLDTHKDSQTQILDAQGKFVIPGFIDSHIHFIMGGQRLSSVQLSDAQTRNEFIQRIKDFAAVQPRGKWILGGEWDHTLWPQEERELPTRAWIDKVTPDNPVWINRKEGHMFLANTLALQQAGYADFSTIPDVEGGTVVRDGNGQPTGLFKDNAMNIVYSCVPQATQDEDDQAIEAATQYCFENGVTSIHHLTEPPSRNRACVGDDISTFESAHKRGRLKIRAYVAVPIENWEILRNRLALPGAWRGDKMLRIGAVKGYVDGSLGSHTAWFFDPYVDTPNYAGETVNSESDLYRWIKGIDAAGMQVFIHAIGDRANHIALNIYERVQRENGRKDRRWRIEHAQHVASADFHRFRELGVIASVQPYHAIDDGRWAESILGTQRCKNAYAFRSFQNAGVHMAFGSDWFVAPPVPLLGIHAAVVRQTLPTGNDNKLNNVFVPEQCVSVQQALYSYTLGAAYSVHEEGIKGSIAVGKLADFAILDHDLFTVRKEFIEHVKVEKTVLGGKLVYEGQPHQRVVHCGIGTCYTCS